jgi:sporulation protein YlmC with PRC-barrel domain
MRSSVLIAVSLAAIAGAAAAQTANHFVSLPSEAMLSSNLTGLDVYDNSNNDIGKIKDVALDSSKMVKAYILSVGGFLGMGTHYVSVEPDAVKIKYDDNDKKWHANMNATKDELKAAPEFKYEGRWSASKT